MWTTFQSPHFPVSEIRARADDEEEENKINFNKQIDEATEEIEEQTEVSLFNLLN